jgi:hypothetical protein
MLKGNEVSRCAAPMVLCFSSMLSQRLPLQRAKRASAPNGLICGRASDAWMTGAIAASRSHWHSLLPPDQNWVTNRIPKMELSFGIFAEKDCELLPKEVQFTSHIQMRTLV